MLSPAGTAEVVDAGADELDVVVGLALVVVGVLCVLDCDVVGLGVVVCFVEVVVGVV